MDKVTQEGLQAVKANFKWIADDLKVLAFTFRTRVLFLVLDFG